MPDARRSLAVGRGAPTPGRPRLPPPSLHLRLRAAPAPTGPKASRCHRAHPARRPLGAGAALRRGEEKRPPSPPLPQASRPWPRRGAHPPAAPQAEGSPSSAGGGTPRPGPSAGPGLGPGASPRPEPRPLCGSGGGGGLSKRKHDAGGEREGEGGRQISRGRGARLARGRRLPRPPRAGPGAAAGRARGARGGEGLRRPREPRREARGRGRGRGRGPPPQRLCAERSRPRLLVPGLCRGAAGARGEGTLRAASESTLGERGTDRNGGGESSTGIRGEEKGLVCVRGQERQNGAQLGRTGASKKKASA